MAKGTLTKKQLCQILNVSRPTLSYYLNRRYYQQLAALGYEKNQKILMPIQITFLCNTLGIDPQEITEI